MSTTVMADDKSSNSPTRSTFYKWLRRISLFIAILIVLWLVFVVALVVRIHQYGTAEHTVESADVIIVLGAGLQRDGRPGRALTRRSDQAAELWLAGAAPNIICTGAQAQGFPRSEAEGCFDVVVGRGVSSDAVLLENGSRSTEENAILSLQIMRENGWESAIIVSDSYHILRAEWIFGLEGYENLQISPVSSSLIRGFPTYTYSMIREVIAFHWQFFKELFGIQTTYVYAL